LLQLELLPPQSHKGDNDEGETKDQTFDVIGERAAGNPCPITTNAMIEPPVNNTPRSLADGGAAIKIASTALREKRR